MYLGKLYVGSCKMNRRAFLKVSLAFLCSLVLPRNAVTAVAKPKAGFIVFPWVIQESVKPTNIDKTPYTIYVPFMGK